MEKLFPDHFDRSKEYNYYEKLKLHAILQCQSIENESDEVQEKIVETQRWLQAQIKPKDTIKEEIAMDRSYEELCILLGKHTNQRVKSMTVMEFYTLLHLIKQKKLQ